jgi:hypothetical protein
VSYKLKFKIYPLSGFDQHTIFNFVSDGTFTTNFCSADRLSLLLAKERSHTQTYIGCMKKGPVFTDPKLKWLASFPPFP